ncbi:MAG: NPCBM/NEW2 domain-containing protein [Pirellulales bacterium]
MAVAAWFWCSCGYADGRLLLADGTTVEARLADGAADGKLAFDAAGKRTTPDTKEIVRWGGFVATGRATMALLDGGDVAVYSRGKLDGDALQLTSEVCGSVRVPIEAVRGLVVQPPATAADGDRLIDELAKWTQDARSHGAGGIDRVTLDNGDAVEGKVTALGDAELTVETDAGAITLAVERVRAVAFGRRGRHATAQSGLRFVIGATDGSRITATTASLSQAGLEAATTWGAKLTIARPHVAAFQTLGGRATYLSDLTASGYKHVPYLATAWPLAIDRNVAGGPLRAVGGERLKGLGMHSAASATYTLDKPYRRFEAELAIDDSVFDDAAGGTAGEASGRRSPRGSVVFRVYTDGGDGVWKLRHTSKTIRGGDEPTPIAIDLAGAKRLSLIVDFADRADEHDRADWLDARLVE